MNGRSSAPGSAPEYDGIAPATPARAPVPGRPDDRAGGSRWLTRLLVALWLAGGTAAVAAGWEYYRLPQAERVYDAGHALYAPTGLVGHSFGYAGTLMIVVGVSGYVARKRWRPLARMGRLSAWLQVHIFLCTFGPFLVVLHTGFRVGGLAAISFWAMVVTAGSGAFGRYVYVRIPRRADGVMHDAVDLPPREARFRRLFHYWHVLHVPVAAVMFAVLALHIAVAIALGYGWPSP